MASDNPFAGLFPRDPNEDKKVTKENLNPDTPLPEEENAEQRKRIVAALLQGEDPFPHLALCVDCTGADAITLHGYTFLKALLQGRDYMDIKDFQARFGIGIYNKLLECENTTYVDKKLGILWFKSAWKQSERQRRIQAREDQRRIMLADNIRVFKLRLKKRIRKVMGIDNAAALDTAAEQFIALGDWDMVWEKFQLKWSKVQVTEEELDELGYTLLDVDKQPDKLDEPEYSI